jgi:hypothetical protein
MICGKILIGHGSILSRHMIQQAWMAVELAGDLWIVDIGNHAQPALVYASAPALSGQQPSTVIEALVPELAPVHDISPAMLAWNVIQIRCWFEMSIYGISSINDGVHCDTVEL